MDADRRVKTVITGTFAIASKSLSNAQPISAGETQRTKAEMTMASMHVPTLHEARAERIYARDAKAPSALSDQSSRRPGAREDGGGGALFSKTAPGRAGGKIGRSAAPLPFRSPCFPSFSSGSLEQVA